MQFDVSANFLFGVFHRKAWSVYQMTKRPTRIPIYVCQQHRSRQRPLRQWILLDQLPRKDPLCWSLRGRSGEWCVKCQQEYRGATTFCRLLWVICHLFWLQENFEQKHDLLIEETELKQVAYIFSCNNCTLQIKGKINSIIVGELPRKIHQKECRHDSRFWCSFASSYLF